MPKNVITEYSNKYAVSELLKTADLVIGAALTVGAKTPHLITRKMLSIMQKGSVLVDVSIDQGGCFETSHPTTHTYPVYEVDGIVHYCVANIPGAVPITSTRALTNSTLPYVIKLANLGWKQACLKYQDLRFGLNVINGKIVFKSVADSLYMPYEEYKIN